MQMVVVRRRSACGWEKWESGIRGCLSGALPRTQSHKGRRYHGRLMIDESPSQIVMPTVYVLFMRAAVSFASNAYHLVDVHAIARNCVFRRVGGVGGRGDYQLH
jgi:hypothetical protein